MEKRDHAESSPDAGAGQPGQAAHELWQRWRQGQGPTLQEVLAHAGELTASQLAVALLPISTKTGSRQADAGGRVFAGVPGPVEHAKYPPRTPGVIVLCNDSMAPGDSQIAFRNIEIKDLAPPEK